MARLAQKPPFGLRLLRGQLTIRFSFPLAFLTSPCYQFFVDRISLFDTIEVEPRPLTTPALEPCPLKPREIAPKGTIEQNGITEADRLLQAIVLVARKEQTPATKGALRNLIAKFNCECGLGF